MDRICILGGGLSGLLLANKLNNSDVFEINNSVGGLCRSVKESGFTFDFGGHILFSKDNALLKKILDTFSSVEFLYRDRLNYILIDNTLIPYPFENGIGALPHELAMKCANEYTGVSDTQAPNLESWLYKCFGKTICELYLFPYNKKIWKRPLSELNISWSFSRVPRAEKKDIIKSAKGLNTIGYKHQAKFFYPKNGGIQALIDELILKNNKIYTDQKIKSIERINEKWKILTDKEYYVYNSLVSSIPLPDLVKIIKNIPDNIRENTQKLDYNTISVVMLGIKGKLKKDFTAIYVPEEKYIYHRVCCMNNFSPFNAPKNCIGLIFEVSHYKNEIQISESDLIKKICDSLDVLDICDYEEIVYKNIMRYKYSYPVEVIGQEERLYSIQTFLKEEGIYMLGRNGEFEYLNMDACFKRVENMFVDLKRYSYV